MSKGVKNLQSEQSGNEIQETLKAEFYLKAVFWLGIMVLTQISRSPVQSVKNLSAHPTYLGAFWYIWR